jgi:hypothetical protein
MKKKMSPKKIVIAATTFACVSLLSFSWSEAAQAKTMHVAHHHHLRAAHAAATRSTSRPRSLRRGRVPPGKACTMDRARGAITTAVFLTLLSAVLSRRGLTNLSLLLARVVNEEAARTAASFFDRGGGAWFLSLPRESVGRVAVAKRRSGGGVDVTERARHDGAFVRPPPRLALARRPSPQGRGRKKHRVRDTRPAGFRYLRGSLNFRIGQSVARLTGKPIQKPLWLFPARWQ